MFRAQQFLDVCAHQIYISKRLEQARKENIACLHLTANKENIVR